MPDLDELLGRAMAWAEPQYLAERKARVAALAEGAELEDADLWPLLMLVDRDLREVPCMVMDRFNAQVLRHREPCSPRDVERSAVLPSWQKTQFRTFGFILIALPMPALVTLPRGRRQLEAVEARLFEALRVWGFALRPAIRLLVERAPSLARASASEVDYLAAHAPDLVAIAATPHRRAESAAAKAQDPGSVEPHDVLRDFLDQLGREGRRLRVRFATEGSDQPFFGDALADRMLARIEAQLPPGVPEAATGLAPICARLLNTLAKGRRLAQAAFEDRPVGMRAYTEGLDRLGDLPMHEVLGAPEQHGKRLHAAAGRVYRAQLAEPLVQPPTVSEADRLTATEMATLAFVADIDPFQISAQHVLLRPEIWAAREYGADAFLRRAGDPARKAVFRHMLTEGVAPNAEAMKQPLVPELASIAGMIGQLRRILS